MHRGQGLLPPSGVKKTASQAEVEHAYKKLASKHHPTRFHEDPVEAQRQFNELTQAYSVLSNPARRDHYDQLSTHKYSKEDALKTFERFFKHNGVLQEEEQFFQEHYPHRRLNHYETLGIRRDAHPEEIHAAFRKLALQHHPKNAGDAEKFKQVCEAYHTLSEAGKRRNYDRLEFGEIEPHHAHQQFTEAFHEHDDDVLAPIVKKSKERQQQHHAPHHYTEELSKETFQEKTPEGTVSKTVTHKSSIANGHKTDIMVEEVTRPDGTTGITQTVRVGGHEAKVSRYELKAGQPRPALLA